MFFDARELAQGELLSADVCIVGAGAAGITLARDLREQGLSVLLLESGGFETDADTQELYAGTMSGISTWQPVQNRVRAFGGTTRHWGGWCRPLLPEDFVGRDGGRSWPLPYEEMVQWYQPAHRTLELGPVDYDARKLAARLEMPLLLPESKVVEPRVYQFSPPVRFGSKFRDELQEATDVHVYLHGNLTNIRLNSSRDGVSHLECKTLTGLDFTVEAGRYVLAMGGLENARILLASDDDEAAGVANASGSVGRFFMEHPHYYSCSAVLSTDFPDLEFYKKHEVSYETDNGVQKVHVRGGIGLSSEARKALGLGNFTLTLDEVYPDAFDVQEGFLPYSTARAVLGSPEKELRLLELNCRAEQTALARIIHVLPNIGQKPAPSSPNFLRTIKASSAQKNGHSSALDADC